MRLIFPSYMFPTCRGTTPSLQRLDLILRFFVHKVSGALQLARDTCHLLVCLQVGYGVTANIAASHS